MYEKFIVNDETWKKGKVDEIFIGACKSVSFAQDLANVIYEKTGKKVKVYATDENYIYSGAVPIFNGTASGKPMKIFEPNIVR